MPKGWSVWVSPSKGRWRCRWTGKHGIGQETFIYKPDAQEFALNKRRDLERLDAGLQIITLKRADFEEFLREYTSWLSARRSSRTCYINTRALTLYKEAVGPVFPSRIDIREFSRWLLKYYKPNAARIYLRACKAAFRWAWKEGMIDYDPFQFFEMPAADPVARVLKPEEAELIFNNLSAIAKRVFIFILRTGLRIGEVVTLDWSDIKEENGIWYLTVIKTKTRRSKPETKTQAISMDAIPAMGERKKGKVFQITKWGLQISFRRAVAKSELGRVRWHDLRHTWATHLMQRSGDIRALMDVGGWATSQAAMLYQHPTSERRNITLNQNSRLPDSLLRHDR